MHDYFQLITHKDSLEILNISHSHMGQNLSTCVALHCVVLGCTGTYIYLLIYDIRNTEHILTTVDRLQSVVRNIVVQHLLLYQPLKVEYLNSNKQTNF